MCEQRLDCDRFDKWLLEGGTELERHGWGNHLDGCSGCRDQWHAHQMLAVAFAEEVVPGALTGIRGRPGPQACRSGRNPATEWLENGGDGCLYSRCAGPARVGTERRSTADDRSVGALGAGCRSHSRPPDLHAGPRRVALAPGERPAGRSADAGALAGWNSGEPGARQGAPRGAEWGWQVEPQSRCIRASLNPAWAALLLGREFPIRFLVTPCQSGPALLSVQRGVVARPAGAPRAAAWGSGRSPV